jgi:undecaprenyl diphosphate synthase
MLLSSNPTLFEAKEAKDSLIIPHHIAIIMDGNRRWAKKRFLPAVAGHWAGASTLKHVLKTASELGVRRLTVYAFSTENWMRPAMEVEALFKVLESYLLREGPDMVKEGVCFKIIGDVSGFPSRLLKVINNTVSMTSSCDTIELAVALNYGSRNEITRAVKSLVSDCLVGKITKEDISEDVIASYLDTKDCQDPELLIRTSGEMRLSNFLLWQISYSEVYVTDVLWPDFSKEHLMNAIVDYNRREKRLGT